MPVKFTYDPQFGLRIEPELDSELSREEAMIVAVRDLAAGMNSLSQAMWEFYDEFRFKQFYKPDEPSPARAPDNAPAKKSRAPTRKKAPAVKTKKRRK